VASVRSKPNSTPGVREWARVGRKETSGGDRIARNEANRKTSRKSEVSSSKGTKPTDRPCALRLSTAENRPCETKPIRAAGSGPRRATCDKRTQLALGGQGLHTRRRAPGLSGRPEDRKLASFVREGIPPRGRKIANWVRLYSRPHERPERETSGSWPPSPLPPGGNCGKTRCGLGPPLLAYSKWNRFLEKLVVYD
jgi:hypothetical protein